jgi:predicted SnoaL-like aldol condensation-catalyzing enzyme/heme-degrading monooxygenase HmoA
MKYTVQFALVVMTLFLSYCTNKQAQESKTIMEVTTFKIKSDASPAAFKKLDAKVEADFTSKQPGFIKRQSGVDEKGAYVVVVFWDKLANADASIKKFMTDSSVADYAKMIDESSMKMERFAMDKPLDASNSEFVEIMSFELNSGVDQAKFKALNQQVETDFTSKREGFVQRLTGANKDGKRVVAVYWTNQATSDASINDFMAAPVAKKFMKEMNQKSVVMGRYKFLTAKLSNKEKAVALLNSFNTGDKTPISYVNPNKYIQHNLSVGDGLAGFGEVMKQAPPEGFKAKVVRAFEDGDYVVTHTIYDFFGPKIGFDIFKFENGLIVEHWDNLIEVKPANPSGRTQTDGTTEVTDKDKTAANKTVIKNFITDVLLNNKGDKVATYINPKKYLQHNPAVADGLKGFGEAMEYFAKNKLVMKYEKLHKVIGEGNFVLAVSEGKFGKGAHTAFYDLFRLENGQIVEHWDVIATIPPEAEWKNKNGKF